MICKAAQQESTGRTCLYFFYGNGCPNCAEVEPYIEELEQKYPRLVIYRFEIYENRSNLDLLNNLFEKYNVPQDQRKIPAIFIHKEYVMGNEQIREELEDIIKSLYDVGCECPSLEDGSEGEIAPISFFAVTLAALADSINPCAIGTLIFLLSLLSISKDKSKLLSIGVAFTVSLYVAYFLFGLGILTAVKVVGLSFWFYKFMGVLVIIIGVLEVKDFIRYGSLGFVTEVPSSLKRRLDRILKTVASPLGAFIAGFAVSLIELPCTGGPYLAILGLLAQETTQVAAIPILLYYNLLFVLPLIAITAIIYFGASSIKRMAHLRHRATRVLHLIIGLTLIALGVAMLLGIFSG
jgi:cytochrome c biogenesis protein CcdA